MECVLISLIEVVYPQKFFNADWAANFVQLQILLQGFGSIQSFQFVLHALGLLFAGAH